MAPGINSFLTSYANGVTPAPVIGGKNSESANKIGEIGKVIWNTVVSAFNTGVRGDSASPKVNFTPKDQMVPEKGSGGKKVAKLYKNKRDEVGALFEDGIEDTREGEVEINFDLLPRAVSEEDEDEEEWDEDEVFEYRPNYTPEAIDRICASKEFALNSENFIISYTGEFLKSYARDYRNTSTFKNHGILASLALTHLNDPTITCGINTAHRCAPTCADVVRKLQSNLDTARSVYFAFQSAQHLAETMKSLNSGLFAAQVNVANLAAEMAGSFFWTEPPPEKREKWLKYALGMAELVIGQVAGAIPQIATSTLVEGLLHSEIDKSKAHIEKWTGELALFTQSMRANIEKGALKAAKAEKLKINGLENGIRAVEQKTELLLKTATAIGRSGGFTGRGREEWAAMGTMTLLSFWKTSIEQKFFANAHDGEKSQSTNENMLQAFVSGTTDATRQGLVRFADKVFGGGEVAEDGSTHFTNLIYSGQFLPGHKASRVGYYHSPEMEE